MQAVLILAHKNLDQLISLTKKLRPVFEVYIHVDVKCPMTEGDKAQFESLGAHLYQAIDVQWGGWSIAAACQHLMRQAMQNPEIDYIHVISGEDWPCQDSQKIFDFYQGNDRIYLQVEPAKGEIKSSEKVENWAKFYFNWDKSPIKRRTNLGKIYHRLRYWSQALLKVDKFKKLQIDFDIYQGAVWCDLPRYAVTYLLDTFDQDQRYYDLFSTSFCPDEMWMQTILATSPYTDALEGNFHRYVNWTAKHGSYPAILDESDKEAVQASQAHFMRKVNLDTSAKLLKALELEVKS